MTLYNVIPIYMFDNTYQYLNLKELVVYLKKGIGQNMLINMEKTPRRTSKKYYIFVKYGMKVIKLDCVFQQGFKCTL
jgi:hypothetical protein